MASKRTECSRYGFEEGNKIKIYSDDTKKEIARQHGKSR